MRNRKPSANAKHVQQSKSQLGDLDDLFAPESRRGKRLSEEKEAARRLKSCGSKNRHVTKGEAELAIALRVGYCTKELKPNRCPYREGRHLTSHP